MILDLRPFLLLWVVLAAVSIVLTSYSKSVVSVEIEAAGPGSAGRAVALVGRCGQGLAALTVLSGLWIALSYVRQAWPGVHP
jgi:hypothetical protein